MTMNSTDRAVLAAANGILRCLSLLRIGREKASSCKAPKGQAHPQTSLLPMTARTAKNRNAASFSAIDG